MSQLYIKGPVCGVDNCPSVLYRHADGHKICQYGHVQEGDIEINDDQDDNFVVTRRLGFNQINGKLLAKGPKVKFSKRKRLTGNPGKEMYLKCLQIIFKYQIKAVINELFPPDKQFEQELNKVVKIYWIRLLDSYLKNPSIRSNSVNFNTRPGARLPTVFETAFIVYYSILKLNYYPIYFHEFVSLLKTNKVPFLKTIHLLPPINQQLLPFAYFASIEMNLTGDLDLQLRLLVKKIGLPTIEKQLNYFYPFIFKVFSQELLLPNSLELFALVHNLCTRVNYDFKLTGSEQRQKTLAPDVMVAAFMVLAVKIYFIYLNKTKPLNYKDWLNNLHKFDTTRINKSEFSSKKQQESIYNLIEWSDDKINSYCDYLNEIFNNESPRLNSTIYQRLFSIFNLSDDNFAIEPSPELNSDDYIENSRDRLEISHRDIYIVENYLFKKFSALFCIEPKTFHKYYQLAEQVLKQAATDK